MSEAGAKGGFRPSHGVVAFGLIGVTLGVMFLLHSGVLHEKNQTKGAVENALAVSVMIAEPSAFERQLSVAGEARPRNDVRVYAPVQGVRITQLLVDEGAFVRAAWTLALPMPKPVQHRRK
jgi:multidrug efflux pump subunit AcrA (membrane-fusion protein)